MNYPDLGAAQILYSITDPLIILQGGERIIHVNAQAAQVFGRTATDLMDRDFWAELPEEKDQPLHQACRRALVQQSAQQTEEYSVSRQCWYEWRIFPFRDGLVLLGYDITERQAAEVAMASLAAIVSSSDDAIVAKDLNGVVTSWNAGAQRIFGYPPDEMVGQPILRLIPSDRAGEEEDILRRIRRGERVDHFETIRRTRDGRLIDVSVTISPVKNRRGEVVGASKVARDITGRKLFDEALRESEDRYRTLFETMAQGVVYQDHAGVILSANPAAQRLLGLSLDEMQGRTSLDSAWKAVHEDGSEVPGVQHPAMVALATGEAVRDVILGVPHARRGEIRWLRVDATPLFRSGEARPYQVYTTFEDVTEVRQTAMRQRLFLRDMLASVTEGRLILCLRPQDFPRLPLPLGDPIPLSMTGGLRDLRRTTAEACRMASLSEQRATDLTIAASEAGMNAVVHVGAGEGQVFVDTQSSIVWVRVVDYGRGIALENLPRATLQKGYSSAGTLGHGMKMMLQTVDRVCLMTDGSGTTVLMEQGRIAPPGIW